MKHLILCLCLTLPLPAMAQDQPRPLGQMWGEFLRRIDPFLGDLADLLGDLSGWHAPQVQPNGDILIRRRQPSEPTVPEEATPDDTEPPIVDPLEL